MPRTQGRNRLPKTIMSCNWISPRLRRQARSGTFWTIPDLRALPCEFCHGPIVPLSQIGSSLRYHSNVSTNEVLRGLSRLVADQGRGRLVFHQINTDAERGADTSRSKVGLALIAGKLGAPFAIIAPGGGLLCRCGHEGGTWSSGERASASNIHAPDDTF